MTVGSGFNKMITDRRFKPADLFFAHTVSYWFLYCMNQKIRIPYKKSPSFFLEEISLREKG